MSGQSLSGYSPAATNLPSDDPLAFLQKLSNRDKHRLLTPMIAAVSETDSWVASSNADFRFTYLAKGAVEDGTAIVAFTATPHASHLGGSASVAAVSTQRPRSRSACFTSSGRPPFRT
jgi:hypothetical protein